MEIKLQIPEYHPSQGIKFQWEYGFKIDVQHNGGIVIRANKEGLVSLANHLLNLAQNDVPIGHHMHFDPFNALEDGSLELIIEKI